ncbi:unnamed protein product [Rhizoctonia solani]|uniref:Uncharacterized protein n=1 Tax=Rhizoctonia solani TaxID=456999 RepID=A0A8H3GMK1_9AGAM|nr:unnamed protein product [Rhizoctonia solani]
MDIMIPSSRLSASRTPKNTKQQMGNGSIIPVNDQQTTGAKVEPALSSQQHYQPQQGYNSAQVGSGANIPRRDQPISTDSDLEGAELNKEARFWKVYVKEADQYDTDLVDGWNKYGF